MTCEAVAGLVIVSMQASHNIKRIMGVNYPSCDKGFSLNMDYYLMISVVDIC